MAGAEGVLFALACCAGGVGGMCATTAWMRMRARNAVRYRYRREGVGSVEALDANMGCDAGMAGRIVYFAARMSRKVTLGACTELCRGSVGRDRVERWLADHAKAAGIEDDVTVAGFREARLRVSGIGAAAGALVGAVFSTELCVLLGIGGGLVGFASLRRSVRAVERARANALERHLSEMLEVVSLGLRSGLSFDRSFELYGSHFDSALATASARAQRRWNLGLMTREEALRDLAASYDSALFGRVIENAIRSLRFGSSLSESFESAAAEARAVYRACVEEKVAKAPVKMMVPTGTLILPAMLLLVLGPVLLELMGGF